MLRTNALRSALLCVPALLLFAPAGRADTAFTITGNLVNGSTVSGTVNIDTVGGTVDAVNLIVAGAFNFTANQIGVAAERVTPAGVYQIEAQDFFGVGASFVDLELPVTTLVGYAGGSVCAIGNPCPGTFVSDAASPGSSPASSFTGSASASAVPEPSTIFLMIGGGAMLLAAKRRANRNRKTILRG